MKKKLVAVAVAGVLGVPLAAHAQTANVTLYGRMNLDFEMMNGKQADGTQPERRSVELEHVALRPERRRVAGWWPERDLPDRIRSFG